VRADERETCRSPLSPSKMIEFGQLTDLSQLNDLHIVKAWKDDNGVVHILVRHPLLETKYVINVSSMVEAAVVPSVVAHGFMPISVRSAQRWSAREATDGDL